jgi:hypothetical protein
MTLKRGDGVADAKVSGGVEVLLATADCQKKIIISKKMGA